MSSKQKTAVDLAFEYIENLVPFIDFDMAYNLSKKKYELKKLEKHQIVDAYVCGKTNGIANTIGNETNKPSEQYYKETYGE